MDRLLNFINNLLDGLSTAPPKFWYSVGVTAATVPIVIGIIVFIQRHHLKKTAEDLKTHFVYLNLILWSTLMTVADWVITNGHSFATFLPYLNAHWTQIAFYSSATYTFSKAAYNFYKDQQSKKIPFAATLPELTPLVQQITRPVNSFGTEATGRSMDIFK